MNCERCGGPCWDNQSNKKNPRGPDFSCKDKLGCGWKKWLTPKPGPGAPTARVNGATGGGTTWNALAMTYRRCWAIAGKVVGADSPDRVAAAATIFIAANQKGLSAEAPKPAPPPPPPPPPPVEEDFDPAMMGESDDDY